MAEQRLRQAFQDLERSLQRLPSPQREQVAELVVAYVRSVDIIARTVVDPPGSHDYQPRPINAGSGTQPTTLFACPCCQGVVQATCATPASTP